MSAPQLPPIHEWTLDYVKQLPATELEWLDFKQSAWLKPDEDTFRKLSIYVSAFANYAGGYLVLGCKDPKPGVPLEFDEGVDFLMKNGVEDWLEDKIPPIVDPPVSRISVQAIPFSPGATNGILVIRIEPSLDAPHQARDKIFYQRVGTKNSGLGTQHVMDIRNRQRHAKIDVRLKLTVFEVEDKNDIKGKLTWELENLSDVFCRHIALVIKAPALLGDKPLSYKDFKMEPEANNPAISYFRLSAGNGGTPLFPRGKLRGDFKVQLINGTWNIPIETGDSFLIRAFADGAPPEEFTILQKDVTTVSLHHKHP